MNRMNPALLFHDFLHDVERNLSASLVAPGDDKVEAKSDLLSGAARHLCIGAGGKRARPILVKIFGSACGAPVEALVELGVAAELIHSASLLHDDVVDSGMFRRGRPTVNARWGNIVAVMTGDILLTTALAKLSAFPKSVTQQAIATVAEMTRAAIAEVEAREDLELSVERLRWIAEGKTGSLFGWCGTAAALVAENPVAASHFDAFGRRIGVAFQIADDVRDLAGTDPGKPRFADIMCRTPSLPILLAAQRDAGFRRRLKDAWAFSAMTPTRVNELGLEVLASGAVEEAISRMGTEIDAAVEALGPYAESEDGARLVAWARALADGLVGKE